MAERSEEKLQEEVKEEVVETTEEPASGVAKETPTEEAVEAPVEEDAVEDDAEKAPEEAVVEDSAEAEAEQVEDAPAEETVEEEKPVDEPVEEDSTENEAPDEEEREALSKDISRTKEELALISEVREEVTNAYAQVKILNSENEALKKELNTLKTEYADASEKLSVYVKAEEELLLKQHNERLSRLSGKFANLGREKSVEQLSKLDNETLSEFELIVDAALDKAGEVEALPTVTSQSQSVSHEKLKADSKVKEKEVLSKTQNVVKSEKLAKDSNENFFTKICDTLTSEQVGGQRGRAKYL